MFQALHPPHVNIEIIRRVLPLILLIVWLSLARTIYGAVTVILILSIFVATTKLFFDPQVAVLEMTSLSQFPRDRILWILTNNGDKMERSRLRAST